MKNSKKGFTLVELLVVIAILAILASVSVVGYTKFIEKAAKSNDDALTTQINVLISGEKISQRQETFDKLALSAILKPALGGPDDVVIQSNKYGYDIYWNEDINEFVLITIEEGEEKLWETLSDILGWEENITPPDNPSEEDSNDITIPDDTTKETFTINELYSDTKPENGYTTSAKMNTILDENGKKLYQLEVEIYSYHNENNGRFVLNPHTVSLNDLVNTSNSTILNYSLETVREVVYSNTQDLTRISDNQITFNYPGTFELTISDGEYEETINVSVVSKYYSDAIITDTTHTIKTPNYELNLDDTYTLYLPIFSYIKIEDYFYSTASEMYTKFALEGREFDSAEQLLMFDSKQLRVTVNEVPVEFTTSDNRYCVSVPNLTEKENILTVTYAYQGFNGKWVYLTQTYKVTIGDNSNVNITKQ